MHAAGVTVKLFGPAAQRAGRREVLVPIAAEQVSCGELRRRLAEAEPAVGELLPACRFAVNNEFVDDAAMVRNSDEVALIGMVCGG